MIDPFKTNTTYLGCPVQQSNAAIAVLERLLNWQQPDIIIEIGTALGGLTMYLGSWAHINGAQLHTYNIEEQMPPVVDKFTDDIGVKKHIGNVFDSDITEIISCPKKVFLYCDGGNKTKELAYYNRHIKIGDVIGCHDYTTEVSPFIIDAYMDSQGFNKIVDGDFKKLKTLQMFWERRHGKKDTVCGSDC